MRIAPRSYSPSVDLRVSNVPRQDLPSSDCCALSGAATAREPEDECDAFHTFSRRRDDMSGGQPDRSARRKDDFTIRRWKGAIPAI